MAPHRQHNDVGGPGAIYSIDPSTFMYVEKELDYTNGAGPLGSLMQANDGKLYSMTNSGGNTGAGNILSFDPLDFTYTSLRDFSSNEDGINISSTLVQARSGKLYGVAYNGGKYTFGVIFSYDPFSSTYTKIKDFDGSNGGNPLGGLVQAIDGKLYGVTAGGKNGYGVIYSFDPSTSGYVKLMDFDGTNTYGVSGTMVQAGDGKLYGMAGGGSIGRGIIFSFDPLTSTYTNLHDFNGVNGSNPSGSLKLASNGKLYGTTQNGGNRNNPYDYGVLFSFDALSSTYTKVKDFDYANGADPESNLMQASDGKIYGTTKYGGNKNLGVVFSFDPVSSTYTKLQDYNGANGANPSGSFIEVHDSMVNIPPTAALITPVNNATYLAGENVYLNAIATDVDGTVAKWNFTVILPCYLLLPILPIHSNGSTFI